MDDEKFQAIGEMCGVGKDEIRTVSEVTCAVEKLITENPALKRIHVLGETRNTSRSGNGHTYFTLFDAGGQISCVLFSNSAARLGFELQDGMEAVIFGSVSVYKPKGTYQINVELVYPVGEGIYHIRFKQLKEKLEKEGLFRPERKKPLPLLPKTIGIATSTTGAAIQDILRELRARYPNIDVVIAPCVVQGAQAVKSIIEALRLLDTYSGADVIVLARGGGSLEDLACFNDEELARTISSLKTPIITGIGHETDITIADLTADLRTSTPSLAAKAAAPEKRQLLQNIQDLETQLKAAHQKFTEKEGYKKTAAALAIIVILLIVALAIAAALIFWR